MSDAIPFGRYELVERLAQGGMAEVFLARTVGASGFEKELVIKRILPEFSRDPQFVKMFVDEARIAAQLHHPNIVQVFDFDAVDAIYYIAMEFVEGCDLRTIMEESSLRDTRIDIAEALYIAMEVAKALDYAHRRKQHGKRLEIVHRDVSPHNVLVSFEGAVKLTDFGIAKAESRATRTQDGIVKGKTSYMSPEQARGKRLDQRSDLFSLGTLLFELVTLRRLFFAETDREILKKVMAADVPSPRSFNRSIPNDVERIIMRLLARSPDRRYASAADVVEELGRAYHTVAQGSAEMALRERLKILFPERRRDTTGPNLSVDEPGSWPPKPDWPGRTGTPVIPTSETPPPPARTGPPPIPVASGSGSGRRRAGSAPRARGSGPRPSSADSGRHTARTTGPTPVQSAATRLHDPRVPNRPAAARGQRRYDRQSVVSGATGDPKDEIFFESGTRLYHEGGDSPLVAAERSGSRPQLRVPLPWGTTLMIAGMLVVAGVLVGALFALSRSDSDRSDSAPVPTEAPAPARGIGESRRAEGTVIVRSIPSGAEVYVDGRSVPGRTPIALSLPIGQTTAVSVRLAGHQTHELQVEADDVDRPSEHLVTLIRLTPP